MAWAAGLLRHGRSVRTAVVPGAASPKLCNRLGRCHAASLLLNAGPRWRPVPVVLLIGLAGEPSRARWLPRAVE